MQKVCKILCTNCAFYVIIDNTVECKKKYFKEVPIKKTTIYTPIDFDCWEYEKKKNNNNSKC